MQGFAGPKAIWIALFLACPFSAAVAFDESELRNKDQSPPPLRVGDHGPDTAGFHLSWATDAEKTPVTGRECYHLNHATHRLFNHSSEPLVFRWDDAWRWSTKTYPLRGGDDWVIPTTARDFRLVAPSEIKLGQALNYFALGAAYLPIRASMPECEGEQQSSLPPLRSTMSRDILRDDEPATLFISIQSLPISEDGFVSAIEQTITVENLESTSIGLSSLPVFLERISENAQASTMDLIEEELNEHGASYMQLPLVEVLNSSELDYVPENLHNLDYGFITMGEGNSVNFSLPLENAVNSIEERWFSVIAIDHDGNILTNGLASAWVPKAQ